MTGNYSYATSLQERQMNFTSRRSNVRATNGMVATTQPLAAMTGLRALMEGGNAVDAAVATAAVLNVTEPHSTGVGGDLFALVWMSNEKRARALNASGRSPQAASLKELLGRGMTHIPDNSAYAVTVPGAVSGWEALLDRYGSMELSDALRPSIRYAEEGYPVSEVISDHWAAGAPRLKSGPYGGELLLDGAPPAPGDVMKLPTLASTLREIAEGGSEAFYRGPIAGKIARFVQQMGGWLSESDFDGHRPEWVEPVSTSYRGYDCWQCPPPSQGVNALMALNIVEGFDMRGMGFQTADTFHHLIEGMRLAFADALHHVTDPDDMTARVESLISGKYAAERRKLISPDRAMDLAPHGNPPAHHNTVYVSAVDGEGNACSLINSVFMSFGSGLVAPGTGIALHNRGASFSLDPGHTNRLAPRKLPYHTLIPGMVTRNGELWASYGVMGAMQQAQGHLQSLVNMIDFGLEPQQALDAPRFSVRLGEGVAVEDLVSLEVSRELASRGHRIMVMPPHGTLFGSGQIIARDAATGTLTGGSEPRADGCAVGW